MSSSHIIIVARNDKTGEIRLPLEDLTLYGVGGEKDVLETCQKRFDDDWTLALYRPMDPWFVSGTKKREDTD